MDGLGAQNVSHQGGMSRKDSQVKGGKTVASGESGISTVFHQHFGHGQIAFQARLLKGGPAITIKLVHVQLFQVSGQEILHLLVVRQAHQIVELALQLSVVSRLMCLERHSRPGGGRGGCGIVAPQYFHRAQRLQHFLVLVGEFGPFADKLLFRRPP